MTLCQKCHERIATVFITKMADEETTKVQLCEVCAREQAIEQAWLGGLELPEDAAQMPLDELMERLFAQAEQSPETLAAFGQGIGGSEAEEKWSLQELAAYDHLQKTGEFCGDEDLDDAIDEMDDVLDEDDSLSEPGVIVTPEELEQALEAMSPPEREAVGEMLESLDEVQEELEAIMHQHALNAGFSDDDFSPEEGDENSAQSSTQSSKWKGALGFPSPPSVRCPKCQTTWDRLRQDGRAGCASCYATFEEPLGQVIGRMQQSPQHVGKAPRAATRRQRRLEHLRTRRDNRLSMLRERLKAALDGQNYEEAAKLRDKIKMVESTIVDPDV
jgi:protein arginine kinase activator